MGAPDGELHERMVKLDRRTLTIIWAIMGWLLGAAVWAGSTYQRFESMDRHLEKIDTKLDLLNDVALIRQRQEDYAKRMEILERTVLELENRR